MSGDTQTIQPLAGVRADRESDSAVSACNDYLRMGSGRSLGNLIQNYTETDQKSPPTTSLGVLKGWSKRYDWQARAAAYDAGVDEQKTAAVAAARKASLESGLALEFERVEKLKKLAADLEHQIFYEAPMKYGDELAGDPDASGLKVKIRPHLWVRDVKQIGSGEFANEVEIFRYNAAIVQDYRGVLDDIAKETGGRKQQVSQTTIDLSNATDEQVDRIAAGEDPAKVMRRG
jgi:hypothetical protein